MVTGGENQPERQDVDDIDDLLAAYALGILDNEDLERVSAAVAASPELQSALAEAEEAVGLLGLGVSEHNPPLSIRSKVMLESAPPAEQAAPVAIQSYRNIYKWAAVAAAILIIGLASANVVLLDEVFDRGRSIDRQSERIALLDETSASLGAGADWKLPLIWSDMVVSDSSAYSQISSQQKTETLGLFCRTPDSRAGWIIIVNMPLEPDQVYQVWLQADDGVFSGGTFTTDQSGRGFLPVVSERDLDSHHTISLTIEPPGGSPQPTTPILLTGPIN